MKRISVLLLFCFMEHNLQASERRIYQLYDLQKNEFMVSIVGKMAVPEKFTLDVNNLSQYDNSTLRDTRIELKDKKDRDYRKWLEDHEMDGCCGDACALLAPMAIGGFIVTYVSKSIMGMPDDHIAGACLAGCFGCVPVGIMLANKFADSIQPDQSRIVATIALLEIELAKRKEKTE